MAILNGWQLALGTLTLLSAGPLASQAPTVEAVARRTLTGATPSGSTTGFALTADGRYLLAHSTAPDVVPGQLDSNAEYDVFLRDLQAVGAGATTLVSAVPGSAFRTANGASFPQGVSSDGRFVLFQSYGSNLLGPGLDINGTSDLFVRDLQLDELHLVSRQAADPGRAADAGGGEEGGMLSADGRYVAFGSNSLDLVTGFTDQSAGYDAFLFDRVAGTVSLVSHAVGSATTGAGPGESLPRAVSADGRYVLYDSGATNLMAGYVDAPGSIQVYRFDRTTGLSQLVSRATTGATTGSNGFAQALALSPDGRWALFESTATNLVAGTDTNGVADVFVADLDSGVVTLVSHSAAGATTAGNLTSFARALSPDGRWVLFESFSSNLIVAGSDTNNARDVFLFDRQDGSVRLVSRASSSPTIAATGHSVASTLSDDGESVSFGSTAGNLAGSDTNGLTDVFTWNRTTGTVTLRSTARGSTTTAAAGTSCCGLASADGSVLLFGSLVPDLEPPDDNGGQDVFQPTGVPGFVAAAIRREAAVATTLPTGSEGPGMTSDGRFVLLGARARELFLGVVSGTLPIVAVYDRFGHSWDLVSHAHGLPMTAPNSGSIPKAISGNGRFVVFDSLATDLIPGFVPAGFGESVFRYDRLTRETLLVSHAAGQTNQGTTSNSLGRAISDDGRWILFDSAGGDLVPGQTAPFGGNLFLYDAVSRTSRLVNHVPGSANMPGSAAAHFAGLSPNGRFVVFTSAATDLVPGDANLVSDAFLYDRATGLNEAVSVRTANPGETGNGISSAWAISPDGRYALFSSRSTNLLPVATNPGQNAYLRDRQLGTTTLLSHQPGQPTVSGNGSSWPVAVSLDGRFVLVGSEATDLLVAATAPAASTPAQTYLYDRSSGAATLVSHVAGQPLSPGNGTSTPRGLSASGHRVLFQSFANNLGWTTPGGGEQVYLWDRSTGESQLVSAMEADPARGGLDTSTALQLSTEGNTVLFRSRAGELVQGDLNFAFDGFLSSTTILSDGFESGDTSRWTLTAPPLP